MSDQKPYCGYRVVDFSYAARHSEKLIESNPLKLYGVSGEALDIRGQQIVSFRIDGREFKHEFLVCSLPT
jgi:hypothetical protein